MTRRVRVAVVVWLVLLAGLNAVEETSTNAQRPEPIQFLSSAGKCLGVNAAVHYKDGAIVQVWECNGQLQQQWRLIGSEIRSGANKCLDVVAEAQYHKWRPSAGLGMQQIHAAAVESVQDRDQKRRRQVPRCGRGGSGTRMAPSFRSGIATGNRSNAGPSNDAGQGAGSLLGSPTGENFRIDHPEFPEPR